MSSQDYNYIHQLFLPANKAREYCYRFLLFSIIIITVNRSFLPTQPWNTIIIIILIIIILTSKDPGISFWKSFLKSNEEKVLSSNQTSPRDWKLCPTFYTFHDNLLKRLSCSILYCLRSIVMIIYVEKDTRRRNISTPLHWPGDSFLVNLEGKKC